LFFSCLFSPCPPEDFSGDGKLYDRKTKILSALNWTLILESLKNCPIKIGSGVQSASDSVSRLLRILQMIGEAKEHLSEVKIILGDGGYCGRTFAIQIDTLIGATVEIAKRNELHKFIVLPKRWIVERIFAWIEKCHRLWKNCERKINTSLRINSLGFCRSDFEKILNRL
jgi:transposase